MSEDKELQHRAGAKFGKALVVPSDHGHGGHRQRMKERCRREGLDHFADHEILEYLLYFTIPQKNTNELGHLLLQQFGGLAQVLDADYEDLLKVPGIGPHTANHLTSFVPLFRAYQHSRWQKGLVLADTAVVANYLRTLFIGETNELFYLLCLDAKNRLICCCKLSEGSWSGVAVYVASIVREALLHKARAVILAHNHPGALPRPSASDIELTKKATAGLAAVDIGIQDHLIIAGEQYVSFLERGYL